MKKEEADGERKRQRETERQRELARERSRQDFNYIIYKD